MTISLWHRCVDVALLVYRIKTFLYIFGKHLGIYLCGLDVRMGKHLALTPIQCLPESVGILEHGIVADCFSRFTLFFVLDQLDFDFLIQERNLRSRVIDRLSGEDKIDRESNAAQRCKKQNALFSLFPHLSFSLGAAGEPAGPAGAAQCFLCWVQLFACHSIIRVFYIRRQYKSRINFSFLLFRPVRVTFFPIISFYVN